jgi:tetratricopeptide (TPR) repeat protein
VLALKALSLAGQHRFREAVASARQAIVLNPDLPAAYGALADGLIELGQYDQAIDAVQRMLDLKPTSAAYARAAYLRALHGDQAGGLALMKLAVEASAPKGDRLWMLLHLANDQLAAGETTAALRSYAEVLSQQPEQLLALAGMAKIAAAAGDYESAVRYLERVLAQGADPDAHVSLGDVRTVMGRPAEAQAHYEAAERLERAELQGPGEPEYRHLAILLADRGTRLDEAVEIARLDAAHREDIYTADTLAWTLFRSGRVTEASVVAQRAMRLGTKDPVLLFHAGLIAAAAGDRENASAWLREALRRHASLGPLRAAEARAAYEKARAGSV